MLSHCKNHSNGQANFSRSSIALFISNVIWRHGVGFTNQLCFKGVVVFTKLSKVLQVGQVHFSSWRSVSTWLTFPSSMIPLSSSAWRCCTRLCWWTPTMVCFALLSNSTRGFPSIQIYGQYDLGKRGNEVPLRMCIITKIAYCNIFIKRKSQSMLITGVSEAGNT